MALPQPTPGLVISYSYLWAAEHARGQEEGLKDRPCVIILAIPQPGQPTPPPAASSAPAPPLVTILPITHTPPGAPDLAVEIPPATKQRLGLDDARSWVILSEANRFTWPGPDLRPVKSSDPATIIHGQLPHALVEQIRLKLLAAIRAKTVTAVTRTNP